jgi:8-oxo-dGTP pyrophosphatase MutT (NUDIX family)
MISRKQIPDFKKKFDVVSVFIEHENHTLLLHRQDHKPQGNTWAMLAGKVKNGEDLLAALVRETEEEIGLVVDKSQYTYFEGYFVRYPEYDYMYHVFHLRLAHRPSLKINKDEHKDYCWIKPVDALKLNLIQDEDVCIKWFYNVE